MYAFADGTIVLNQENDHRMLAFDSQGRRVAEIGRRGHGPGEFETSMDAGLHHDSLWIYDDGNGRVSSVAPPYKHVASRPIHFGNGWPIAILDDGGAVLSTTEGWVRVDSKGRRITRIPGKPLISPAEIRLPFSAVPLFKTDPGGSRVVVLRTTFEGPSKGSINLVAIRLPGGDSSFSVSIPFSPERISRSSRDSAKAALIKRAQTTEQRSEASKAIVPEYYPPVRFLYADDNGRTWIGQYTASTMRTWLILDSAGRIISQVDLPANQVVYAAREKLAWTIALDGDGFPVIFRYQLGR